MSNSLITTKVFENYRAYLSVLAEMRKMFYGRGEDEMLQTFLVNLVHHFGFSKVWYGEIVDGNVIPSCHAGPMRQFTDVEGLSSDPTTGPEFPLLTALRENAPRTLTSLESSPDFAPWKDFATRSRARSLCSLPLEVDGNLKGGIVLYSEDPGTFDSAMVDYLQNIVHELSRVLSEKLFWEDQKAILRQARDRAEIATETKSRFLADMSHEIRTPLTVILGYAEMLARWIIGVQRLFVWKRPSVMPTAMQKRQKRWLRLSKIRFARQNCWKSPASVTKCRNFRRKHSMRRFSLSGSNIC